MIQTPDCNVILHEAQLRKLNHAGEHYILCRENLKVMLSGELEGAVLGREILQRIE